jgi:hypothetical protein
VSRISSAVLVQRYGLGSLYQALIHLRMSASSSVTLRCADRRSLRLVSSANHRSTRLIHELVGGLAGGVVVSDQAQPVGDGGADEFEEPQEHWLLRCFRW